MTGSSNVSASPMALSEIIEVVSVTGLLGELLIKGAPQFEQKRDVSGFGRLHRWQKIFDIAPLDLPWGSRIGSGTVAEGTVPDGRGSTRRANSPARPLRRGRPFPACPPAWRRFRHTAAFTSASTRCEPARCALQLQRIANFARLRS